MNDKLPGLKKTREIKALILFALSLFLLLALTSFNPLDPSFFHHVSEKKPVHNLVGITGSYTADLFVQIFGLGAFLFPLFFLLIAVKYLRNDAFVFTLPYLLSLFGIILSGCGLVGLHLGELTYQNRIFHSGGLAGYFLIFFLHDYLKTSGFHILLSITLIISLMVATDLSLIRIWNLLSAWILRITSAIQGSLRFISSRTKRRKRPGLTDEQTETEEIQEDNLAPKNFPGRFRKKSSRPGSDGMASGPRFHLPPLALLDDAEHKDTKTKKEHLVANSRILEKKLADFGVEGKVVEVKPGPVITMYELEPAPGVKINKITNLSDDMALAMKAPSVRIIAPVPGKAVVGIELPNPQREPVRLKEILHGHNFQETAYRLPVALGVDIVGAPVIADLVKMPHLLIAGTTGSGKSVALNAMICSLLFKTRPDEVKLLMIDPKRLELSFYEGIPHLLHPVVVDPKKASQALKWAVLEMERRYKVISEVGAKGIEQYNQLIKQHAEGQSPLPKARPVQETLDALWSEERETGRKSLEINPAPVSEAGEFHTRLPYIVIVIDELADLMMVAQRNVEESLARLAQMSRAAGIHLILATQRPSVDVITGVIKANFPTRISFQVSSKVDSRTILDQHGAEKLLGAGDMLFMPPGTSRLDRIHGVYVSDKEIDRIVEFIKRQAKPAYDHSISEMEKDLHEAEKPENDYDEKYDEAVELVTELGQASISLVQRYMKVGYNRAARIIERMETDGIVGPSDGVKPRKVLARKIPR